MWTGAFAPQGIAGYETSLNGAAFVDQGNSLSQNFSGLTPSTSELVAVRAYDVNGVRGPVASASFTTAVAVSGALANMPRLYYNIAATDSNQLNLLATSAYQDWISNFDYAEYLWFPGAVIPGYTYESNMAAIEAKATALGNTSWKAGKYVNSTRFFAPGFGTESGLTQAAQDLAAANIPWALQHGTGPFPTGGAVVDNTQYWVLNWVGSPVSTLNSGRSAWTNGLTAPVGKAVYEWNTALNGSGAAVNQAGTASADLPNPRCKFLFRDNHTWAPNFAGQWQSSSTTFPVEYNTANPPVLAQQGQDGLAAGVAKLRALGAPAGASRPILVGGNASFLTGAAAGGQGPTVYPSNQGLLDLPFGEACIGSVGYAIMGYTPPHVMFQRMQLEEQSRSSDPLADCIFNSEGGGPVLGTTYPASQSNWGNPVTGATAMPTNFNLGVATNATSSSKVPAGSYYQLTRYALGFPGQRQWAFDLDNVPFTSGVGRCWLDEYNNGFGPGGGNLHWWGPVARVSPSTPTLPISGGQLNGVYVFHYPNCDIYLNPLGNGLVHYTLQSGDKKNMIRRGGFNDGVDYIVGGVLTLQDADMRIVVT